MNVPLTRIVCMGDSITRGIRPGVEADQTYEARLEQLLSGSNRQVQVLASGVGSEETKQAMDRFARDVLALQPDCVTIMYGTNDSYVYEGDSRPHLTVDEYESNLRTMVGWAREAGIQVVLMTPIPLSSTGDWMRWSPYKEQGANHIIEAYVEAVRRAAGEEGVPMVNNYAAWMAETAGGSVTIDDLTTDGCHPNPAGHELIASAMHLVLSFHLSRG